MLPQPSVHADAPRDRARYRFSEHGFADLGKRL